MTFIFNNNVLAFVLTDSPVAPATRKATTSFGIETTEEITTPENLATTENEIMTTVTYPGNYIRRRDVMKGEWGRAGDLESFS